MSLPAPPAVYDVPERVVTTTQPQFDAGATPAARTTCHHTAGDLVTWDAAWGSGSAPTGAGVDVTIPSGMRVLVRQCDLQDFDTVGAYGSITVPPTSWLVFDDAPITLHVADIQVAGTLWAGGATCRRYSTLDITFHGAKPVGAGAAPDKGIIVHDGGVADIHGKEFTPTWSRLAANAWPGTSRIYLQDVTNWEVGQRVVIVTSAWDDSDRATHQNEFRTITAVARSVSDLAGGTTGTTLELDAPLDHPHYAGSEYQTEVGLVSRRVRLTGAESDSSRDPVTREGFGGQVKVHGGGLGRFAGIEAARMGGTNMLGR